MIAVEIYIVGHGLQTFEVERTRCSDTLLTLTFPESGHHRSYPLVNIRWFEERVIEEKPEPEPEETLEPEPWPPGQIIFDVRDEA